MRQKFKKYELGKKKSKDKDAKKVEEKDSNLRPYLRSSSSKNATKPYQPKKADSEGPDFSAKAQAEVVPATLGRDRQRSSLGQVSDFGTDAKIGDFDVRQKI